MVFKPWAERAPQSLLASPVALQIFWGARQILVAVPQAARWQRVAMPRAAHSPRGERERPLAAHSQPAERSQRVVVKRQPVHQQLAEARPPAAPRQRVERRRQVA